MEIFFTDKVKNLDILKELSLLKYISINFEKPTKLKNAKHTTIYFPIVKIGGRAEGDIDAEGDEIFF